MRKRTKSAMVAAVFATLLVSLSYAGDKPVIHSDKSACMEGPVSQFGRYIGDWKITDETLAQDGSTWGPGNGARWIFSCVGPGLAVQDYWMPNSGGFGTNLRTFNPDTGSWEIVWAAGALNGLTHISAKQDDDGSIVMNIVKPVQDPPRRIVFYPPDDGGWNWAQQWSLDGGESWFDVYRIRATPWTE
jgi:hypothetical protein